MSNINYSKVLIGGAVAGIVWLAMDMLSMVVLGMDMEAWLTKHNLQEPNPAVFIVMALLFGLMAVWLYAAIRPRFGPGPKTAAIAGVFIWILFCLIYMGFHALGMFTPGDYAKMSAYGLVQVLLATLAGAWLYREGDTAARM